jgi:membrane-bound lytic murein transglycosylase B
VADARLTASVTGTDLPFVALDAYAKAAASLGEAEPDCQVGWPLLAGIGRTESDHGRFAGSVLGPDGATTPPILGIALDGTRSARITDTDGGALDGDTAFDRAVGPMQFIPGTWARWGRDGNGDAVVDPHNLYDAAMAAATYLCATSSAMADEPGARRGLLAYNRSVEYGTTVLERARGYTAVVDVVPVPSAAPPPPAP